MANVERLIEEENPHLRQQQEQQQQTTAHAGVPDVGFHFNPLEKTDQMLFLMMVNSILLFLILRELRNA